MQQSIPAVIINYRRWKIHTKINLAPIQTPLGEGNGTSKRPTPNIATAKKWRTKLKGRGFRLESKATGPVEKIPPRLKWSKHAWRISFLPSLIRGRRKHIVQGTCQEYLLLMPLAARKERTVRLNQVNSPFFYSCNNENE